MNTIQKIRWATYNGQPAKEVVTYAQVGTGPVVPNDARKFALSGESGEWIYTKVDACLAQQPLAADVDPQTAPLATGVVLITEAEYDALMAA